MHNNEYPQDFQKLPIEDSEVSSFLKVGISKNKDSTRGLNNPVKKSTLWADERGNLKFVKLVVHRPFTIFFGILLICFCLSFILFQIVSADGKSPFTDPVNQFDLKDIRSIQYDSLRLASDDLQMKQKTITALNERSVTLVQSENADFTYWTFESERPGVGVFGTKTSIAAMKKALDIFTEDELYAQYCQLDYRTASRTNTKAKCTLPFSALNMYYSNATWDSKLVQKSMAELKAYPERMGLLSSTILCVSNQTACKLEGTEEEIQWATILSFELISITYKWDGQSGLIENITEATKFASYLLQVPALKSIIDFSYDLEFSVENPVSMYSRALILWGAPLNLTTNNTLTKVESSTLKETEKNAQKKDKIDADALKRYILDNFLSKLDNLAKEDSDEEINSYYFMGALIFDVLIRIVSKDAMLAIFSLCFVFFWIRINVGSWFLAFVGLLEIFLSVPIAWFFFTVVCQIKYFDFLNALSIFIVAAIGADDIFIFMDAYKQSGVRNVDNLIDLETRMSWVYRRTGAAMAITSATTCTAFLCTLSTPLVNIRSFGIFAAFVILTDYILVMTLFCTAVVIYHNKFENQGCKRTCCSANGNPTADARRVLIESREIELKGDRISEFFRNRVAEFICTSGTNRLFLFVIFTVWISVAIWQTCLIEPTKETEQLLSEDHPLQKSFAILGNEFPTADGDQGLPVHYVWGLEDVDRTGVNLLLNPENFGTPQYNQNFDYNEQCQTELLVICDDFKSNAKYSDLIKRKDGRGSIKCFMQELGAYYVKKFGGYEGSEANYCNWVRAEEWKDKAWQIPPAKLSLIMPDFLQERSCIDETKSISARYIKELGWDGKSMKYASISVESNNLDPFSIKPEAYVRGQYQQFVAIRDDLLLGGVSSACTGSIVMTDLFEKFVFMNNQSIYVKAAATSSLLGVGIAFAVLLISTWSFHIALFASVSITCVLVSVTGTMVLLGWSLGSIESILIGIIAGFSVDYVVHLAHSYKSASGDTTMRIKEAFNDMGISVFNGMITSVAASIPLFFCQLQFFKKFGTFLCIVIGFSWLFANFLFMSVLAQLKIPIKNRKKNTDGSDEDSFDGFEAIGVLNGRMEDNNSDDESFCEVDDDKDNVKVF